MDVKDYFECKILKYNPGKNQTIAIRKRATVTVFYNTDDLF